MRRKQTDYVVCVAAADWNYNSSSVRLMQTKAVVKLIFNDGDSDAITTVDHIA
jgi:hypothetical protein